MITAPLNALIAHCAKGGRFHWEYEHESAFQALIDAVCTAPVLRQPHFEDPFVIDCDTSAYTVGAVLQQEGEKGKLHPIAFLSRTLDATQRNWDIYDKELFAVVYTLKIWRPYLVGSIHKILINTDHNNLTYFKVAQKLNRRQAQWMQELAEFDFELHHVPRKKHIPADFLSRPFGENQGKDDNEDLILLPPAQFASVDFLTELRERRHILQAYHDHPLVGHPSIANTIHLLSQTYQGKEMKEFAEEYVQGCTTCQQNKPRTTHRKAPLQPITTDPHSGPFQMVAMNLITDLPESQGFNAILTIIDHGCSKAAKFIPCNTAITRQEVAALYLQHLVPWFGIP